MHVCGRFFPVPANSCIDERSACGCFYPAPYYDTTVETNGVHEDDLRPPSAAGRVRMNGARVDAFIPPPPTVRV